MSTDRKATTPGNRFTRRGGVVPERRTMSDVYGTNDYERGAPLFARTASSQARREYKALRIMRRAQARAEAKANTPAARMAAVHAAAMSAS